MINIQRFNYEQIELFKKNIKFIRYDEGEYNGSNRIDKKRLLRITRLFIEKYIYASSEESKNMMQYIELKISFNKDTTKPLSKLLKSKIEHFNKSFYSNYLIPYKIINFSTPEIFKSMTHCIIQYNIIKNNDITTFPTPSNFKTKGLDNCNLLNYMIFDSFLKIRDKGDIIKLLINLDNINEDNLALLDSMNFPEDIIDMTNIVSNSLFKNEKNKEIITKYCESRFKTDMLGCIMTPNNFNLDNYIVKVDVVVVKKKYMKYKIKYLALRDKLIR